MASRQFALETLSEIPGLPRFELAVQTLRRLGLDQQLAEFTPVLAGTIPLGIDLPESDLDILCYAPQLTQLSKVCDEQVSAQLSHYSSRWTTIREELSFVANGKFEGFEIEIFGQAQPVEQQMGYRHLLIEQRLLQIGGPGLANQIRELKSEGWKTEPAFARKLNLAGDPYLALLELEAESDESLHQRFTNLASRSTRN